MYRRLLIWVVAGGVVLVAAGIGFYLLTAYLITKKLMQSLQPLPANQIFRSAIPASSSPNKPLPKAETIFEAADSSFTSMERINIQLNINQYLSPFFLTLLSTPPTASTQPSSSTTYISIDINDINSNIINEWHIDFGQRSVLFKKIKDDTTQQTPKRLRPIVKSEPIKQAAYDGTRWVIILDDYHHPLKLPEYDWRYQVILLGSLEEGIKVINRIESSDLLLPLFGLHRAYLFAENNIDSLIKVNKALNVEGIPNGWRVETVGVDRINGYECYRIRASNPNLQSTVWLWFCPNLQNRCVRAEALVSGNIKVNGQPASFAIAAEITEWATEDFKIPMPRKLKITRYFPSSKSEYILFDRVEATVRYLKPIAEHEYHLSIPTDSAHVSDNINNRVYTVGKMVPIAPRKSLVVPALIAGSVIMALIAIFGLRAYRRWAYRG